MFAREFSGRNVLVNAVCPGFVVTEMTGKLPEEVQKKLTDPSVIPLKRPGKQEEIASAVKFFCSDDSSYITGTYLRVDVELLSECRKVYKSTAFSLCLV